jgi:hypothetical protein
LKSCPGTLSALSVGFKLVQEPLNVGRSTHLKQCSNKHIRGKRGTALKAPLPLDSYLPATQETSSAAALRLPSIPPTPLRTPALAEPTEFSLGFLWDLRPAIYRAGGGLLFDSHRQSSGPFEVKMIETSRPEETSWKAELSTKPERKVRMGRKKL